MNFNFEMKWSHLQPNSRDMCEQILHEMNEISKAMKATTREVHRVGNRDKYKKL